MSRVTGAQQEGLPEPRLEIEVDERLFPFDVVLKASYWMTGRYEVTLSRDDSRDRLLVFIDGATAPLSAESHREIEQRFRRDLIDFRTRMLVEQETRLIRELLVAKAFDDGSEV